MDSEDLGSHNFYDVSFLEAWKIVPIQCNCVENGLQIFSFCAVQKQESQMVFKCHL